MPERAGHERRCRSATNRRTAGTLRRLRGGPAETTWPSCYRRSRRAFSDSRAWNLRPGTHEKLMRAFLEPEVFAGGVRMRAPAAPGATAALELGGSG